MSNQSSIAAAQRLVESAPPSVSAKLVDESDAEFLPCVPMPGKILCIGLNYRRHAAETGMEIPAVPVVFSKFSDTVAGHLEHIPFPLNAGSLDYEGELGLVMGKETFQVEEKEALGNVFGYFPANDMSARDLQFRTSQWLLGKTSDKFCPIGPYIVPAEDAGNPDALRIQTRVNGNLRQDSSTSDMIFSCGQIVSYVSKYIRLLPGDIILTGTPSGVIQGKPESERVWLRRGDVVSVSVERLGTLTNTID